MKQSGVRDGRKWRGMRVTCVASWCKAKGSEGVSVVEWNGVSECQVSAVTKCNKEVVG